MSSPVRHALVVANDRYDDARLAQLRAPASDAEALSRVLGDPEIGGFEVDVCHNEPEHVVRRRLSTFFDDRRPDDVLLLHLSCHGVKDEDGRLYFATPDTVVDHLDATSVPAEFVNRHMTRSRSRRVLLLLDCCYSGAFARGMLSRGDTRLDLSERFEGRGRIVLTASSAMEYSFEGERVGGDGTPSVFTSAVVDGLLTGAADRNADGYVSVDELYDYAYERVRSVTPSQTPGKWVFDVQGDFWVARSPVPEPEPEPEPEPAPAGAQEPAVTALRAPTPVRRPLLGPPGSAAAQDRRVTALAGAAAAGLLPAAAIPLLATGPERWNSFAVLSPLLVAAVAAVLGWACRAVATRRVDAEVSWVVLATVGVTASAGAAGMVKFASQRLDGVAVALAVAALVAGLVALGAAALAARGVDDALDDLEVRSEPTALVLALAATGLLLLSVLLPYDGDSSLWAEVGEGESAEFVLVPAAALLLMAVAVAALAARPLTAGVVLLVVGPLTALHFVGVVVAAARAVGEVGEVRSAGVLGVAAGGLAALAGAAVAVTKRVSARAASR